MKITLRDGLPFISATIVYGGQQLELHNILIDTGSLGTVFASDVVLAIGVVYAESDTVHRIRGVGGTEFVFSKRVEKLTAGELEARDFEIEVGAMDYGFEMDGIIGMDFLIHVGAVIDVSELEVYGSKTP